MSERPSPELRVFELRAFLDTQIVGMPARTSAHRRVH